MGFFSINNWCDSDTASDLRFVLDSLFKKHKEGIYSNEDLKNSVREILNEEIKKNYDQNNTPGYLNVALLIEAIHNGDSEVPNFLPYIEDRQLEEIFSLFHWSILCWDEKYLTRLNQLRNMIYEDLTKVAVLN